MRWKSGPLGSEPVEVMLSSKAKNAALIIVSLDVDAELDEVPTMKSLPLLTFLVTGGSMRCCFLVGKMK